MNHAGKRRHQTGGSSHIPRKMQKGGFVHTEYIAMCSVFLFARMLYNEVAIESPNISVNRSIEIGKRKSFQKPRVDLRSERLLGLCERQRQLYDIERE